MTVGNLDAARKLAEEELGITDKDVAEMTFEEATASPRIKQTAGLIRFWWDAEQVQIQVSRTHQHKDGRVTGEVKVTTTAPGYPHNLHQAQLNFVATRSKADLAKHLTERRNDLNWTVLIEQLAWEVLEHVRLGEPVLEISTEDDIEPLTYAIEPIVQEHDPTVIYGLGESGKSMFALLCAMMVQLPWYDNPLDLEIGPQKNVLYLDWETNYRSITRRIKGLREGMGMSSYISIHYRRCNIPLADDTEAIHRTVLDKNIGFVVIDSVAGACGGDLYVAEPALRMYAALRDLKVTSLLVAHMSKAPGQKETSVYGSGFFNFYARSVWEMKKDVESKTKEGMSIGLFHRKANDSAHSDSIGFRLHFLANGGVRFERTKLGKILELGTQASILKTLGDKGRLEPKDLAFLLNKSDAVIRTELYDLLKQEKVVKLDRTWGLRER